jgi:alkanesulfonate monooxygenase SsuD/methylene tetrahydromethanopterin reductase-like flavin-dependent oxidoreductase (luciferase family)
LRHPLHSAEDYAMVDAISGGRLEFGIGSGNTELDYNVFGLARENDRQRLREAIEVILKTWGNERIGHDGEFWKFDPLTLYPRPMQQPHPPIWVAGTSAEGLGWAGRQGYHIMTVGQATPAGKSRPRRRCVETRPDRSRLRSRHPALPVSCAHPRA